MPTRAVNQAIAQAIINEIYQGYGRYVGVNPVGSGVVDELVDG